MSSASGLSNVVIKYLAPPTGTGAPYTNGGLPITLLDRGRYLVQFAYAVQPITAGATVNSVTYALTTGAVLPGGVGLIQHIQSAASGANIINKCSNMGVITITAPDTPIYLSLTATVSAGNWQSSLAALDAAASLVSFVKIA